jgi:hypothetical protein
MNYKEAINGPGGVRWQAEVENEYQQMVANKVFEVVLHNDLQAGTKIIDSVWVMKKKSNGRLRGQIEDSSRWNGSTTTARQSAHQLRIQQLLKLC